MYIYKHIFNSNSFQPKLFLFVNLSLIQQFDMKCFIKLKEIIISNQSKAWKEKKLLQFIYKEIKYQLDFKYSNLKWIFFFFSHLVTPKEVTLT